MSYVTFVLSSALKFVSLCVQYTVIVSVLRSYGFRRVILCPTKRVRDERGGKGKKEGERGCKRKERGKSPTPLTITSCKLMIWKREENKIIL